MSTHKLPTNIARAVVAITAAGQEGEEIWQQQAFSSDSRFTRIEGHRTLFREVQLLIDGQLAGVVWPLPVHFTGAGIPAIWSPTVGIDAFDLRAHEIDVTPFIPVLCDGKKHDFELQIFGIKDVPLTHEHGNTHNPKRKGTLTTDLSPYWVISGTIFIFLDKSNKGFIPTQGDKPKISAPEPLIKMTSDWIKGDGKQVTRVREIISVSREITIESALWARGGGKTQVQWKQSLSLTGSVDDNFSEKVKAAKSEVSGTSSSMNPSFKHTYKYTNEQAVGVEIGFAARNLKIAKGLEWTVSGPYIYPAGVHSFSGALPADFNIGGFKQQPIQGPRLPNFRRAKVQVTQKGSATRYQNVGIDNGNLDTEYALKGGDWGSTNDEMTLYTRHMNNQNLRTLIDDERLLGTKLDYLFSPYMKAKIGGTSLPNAFNITGGLDKSFDGKSNDPSNTILASASTATGSPSFRLDDDQFTEMYLLGRGDGKPRWEIDGSPPDA